MATEMRLTSMRRSLSRSFFLSARKRSRCSAATLSSSPIAPLPPPPARLPPLPPPSYLESPPPDGRGAPSSSSESSSSCAPPLCVSRVFNREGGHGDNKAGVKACLSLNYGLRCSHLRVRISSRTETKQHEEVRTPRFCHLWRWSI